MVIISFFSKIIEFILSCFFRGIILFAPFFLTFYIISICFNISKDILGLGLNNYCILGILSSIILCGYFTKNIIIKSLYNILELVILRIPGINFVYSSFKDLTSAFIDKKVNFDKPVLVCINATTPDIDIKKIGFITNENIDIIGENDEVAVFIPQSFSIMITGEIILVPKNKLKKLDEKYAKTLIKFVMSGGFIDINKESISKEKK